MRSEMAAFESALDKQNSTRYDALRNSIGDEVSSRMKPFQDRTHQRLDSVQRDLMWARHSIERFEAEHWEEKKVPANALLTLTTAIDFARRLDSDVWVNDHLEKMRALLGQSGEVSAHLAMQIEESLRQLDPKYSVGVQAVRAMLRKGLV